jgi:hypothetical protein
MQEITKNAFAASPQTRKSAKSSHLLYFFLGALLLATAAAIVWVLVQMTQA